MCLPSGMEALSLFDAQLAPQIDLVPSVELTQASARPMASMAPMGSMAPMAQMAAPMPVGPALLAVDGNSLVHRAYHAYGETGAVYGFLALLAAICDLSGPDAVVVGFDCRDGNDRKRRCAYYKANRAEKDSGLVTALAEVPEVLTELGVHVVCVPGQEADDVLGSAAATAEADAWRCVLATSDRDAFGLISDRTSVLRLRNGLANARDHAGVGQPVAQAQHARAVADEPKGVPVAGGEHAAPRIGLGRRRRRAEHVVGLLAGHAHDVHPQLGEHLRHLRQGGDQTRVLLGAVGLVVRATPLAVVAVATVEADHDRVGTAQVADGGEQRQESVDGAGLAVGVVSAVDQRVAVHREQR